MSHGGVHGLLHTALDVNRARTGRHAAKAFAIDGLGEHGGGGGAIAGHVAGFAGGLADHLRAHIFKGAFQFDLLGHGDTVFGGSGGAEFFVDEHVAAFGAERDFHRFGEFFNTAQDSLAGFFVEYKLFG